MFDVGGGELLLIVIVVLLLFGPKRIPEIAQMFGKGMQKVREAQNQLQSHINDIKSEVENAGNPKINPSRIRPRDQVDTEYSNNPTPTKVPDINQNTTPSESAGFVPLQNDRKSNSN